MLNTLPDEFHNLGRIRNDLFQARVTTKVWREILLADLDTPILEGKICRLVGKRIGPGVYEIRIQKEEEE